MKKREITVMLLLATGMTVFSSRPVFGKGIESMAVKSADAEENRVALDDLGISIVANHYAAIRQNDASVYIYSAFDGSIPYVTINAYEVDLDEEVNELTEQLSAQYDDLEVVLEEDEIRINGLEFRHIIYAYSEGENKINDERLLTVIDGKTYVFGAVEIPGIGYVLSNGYFSDIAGSIAPLSGWDDCFKWHIRSKDVLYPLENESESGLYVNKIILDDLGIMIQVDEYEKIIQEDGFVYVYTMDTGVSPRVVIGRFDEKKPEGFLDKFTSYMYALHREIYVVGIPESCKLGGRYFDKLTFMYDDLWVNAWDQRLFTEVDGTIYMFGSIERGSNKLPSGMLEDIAASFTVLTGEYDAHGLHVNSEESIEKGIQK